jgi:DNA-binding transcriptional regulator YiaG
VSKDPSKIKRCPECKRMIDATTMRPLSRTYIQGRVALLQSVPIKFKALKPKESDFEPQTIGEHIKKRRLLLGLTQKSEAKMLKVTQFSIINWERGHIQPSRAATLQRIIDFLGYDPLPEGQTIPERLRQKRRQMGWGQRRLRQGCDAIRRIPSGGLFLAANHEGRDQEQH